MLVLSREKNQSVELGCEGLLLTGPVVVTVVEIRGNKVRLGFESPREVPINRQEIADRIREQVGEEK